MALDFNLLGKKIPFLIEHICKTCWGKKKNSFQLSME